jgi:hypothetical protein
MKILTNLAVAILSCYASFMAHSAEQRFICPERLTPEMVKANRPPTGWIMYMPRGARLTEGGMLHGAPDQSAYMVPDDSNIKKSGQSSIQTDLWIFPAPEGEPTWVYCGYGGAGAPLQLFKRVADDATQCTLTSKTRDGLGKDVAEFVCK